MKIESIKMLVLFVAIATSLLVVVPAPTAAVQVSAPEAAEGTPAGPSTQPAEVFRADFSSSTNLASYVGRPARQNQFNEITASEGNTFSVENNALVLRLVKPGAASVITRSTLLTGAPFKFLRFEMTVNYKFAAKENAALPFLEFNKASVNKPWAAPGFQSTGVDNEWKVEGGGGNAYSGVQTIRVYLNNSGSPVTYKAPDGSSESVASGAYDLWVGNIMEVDEAPARNPDFTIGNFRIVIPHNCVAGTLAWMSFVASTAP